MTRSPWGASFFLLTIKFGTENASFDMRKSLTIKDLRDRPAAQAKSLNTSDLRF
jgi:hypothetical protein